MCHMFCVFINWFGTCIWKSDLFDIHLIKQSWKDMGNGHKWSRKVMENHFDCCVCALVLRYANVCMLMCQGCRIVSLLRRCSQLHSNEQHRTNGAQGWTARDGRQSHHCRTRWLCQVCTNQNWHRVWKNKKVKVKSKVRLYYSAL